MINQNWIFGVNCGLDFSTAIPTPTSGFAISTLEGCASISDSSGNLLLYTDGQTVWDGGNVTRVTGLLGNNSSTQSAIIVPDPGNSQQYYIFTADGASGSNNHFNGGRLDTGSWAFTPLSSIMTMPNTTGLSPVEKVTAIQHENCRDFWVITVLQDGPPNTVSGAGIVRVFLVNSSTVQHIGDTPIQNIVHDLGYLKGSPDGKLLAMANFQDNNIYVLPFDNSTGIINTGSMQTIDASTTFDYGIEFSPDSQLLYFSHLSGPIYQVDLNGTLTPVLVGNTGGQTGALQLGIDGRIYIALASTNTLGAITNPNTAGTGCNVVNTFITLPSGSNCLYGLPNLIPNACKEDSDCGCTGCNKDSEKQNEELIERAQTKTNTIPSDSNCPPPFSEECNGQAVKDPQSLSPCFYFHWGDGTNDQIEEHDTEVFYLTACNAFNDIQYNGLRITKVTLIPDVHPLSSIHIVPDRFISLDCLEPCSCQTREFAIITRDKNIAGNYTLQVEYCFESISLVVSGKTGRVEFPVTITED